MISNSGKIFDSSAANHNDRVLLEIVTDAWNVSGHFRFVRQANSGDLSKSGVGLFGCGRFDKQTDAAHLGISLECGRFCFLYQTLSAFADQLVDRRQ